MKAKRARRAPAIGAATIESSLYFRALLALRVAADELDRIHKTATMGNCEQTASALRELLAELPGGEP